MNKLSKIIFTKSLQQIPQQSIVLRYTPQRSVYDKTSYIEDFIPRNTNYHYKRKPALKEWTDPNIVWPQLLPQPTKSSYKSLIQEVEKEQKKLIEVQRDFKIPDFRAGDVIQFTYMHGLSEGKSNIYTGVVVGRRRRNTLGAIFRVIFRFCGVEVFMSVMQHSPFVKDLKLVSRGQGNLRSQLTYLWTDRKLTADSVKRPILKGKKPRKRKGDKITHQTEGGAKKNIQFDTYTDPIFNQY